MRSTAIILAAALLTGCGSGAPPQNHHLHAALQRARVQTRLAQQETAAAQGELTECQAAKARLQAEVVQHQTHATQLESQVQQLQSEIQEAQVDVEEAETTTSVSKLLTYGFCAVLALTILLLGREVARRREKAAQ